MPMLMLKDMPRYECLLEAAQEFPDLDPSATEVFLHILRAGDEAFRIAESHLAQHDISQGRFGVMMALWGHARHVGPSGNKALTPAELAERTGVTRATITGLVDTLERAGLVTRTPHQEDRRMMSVELTVRAENLIKEILPQHFRRMAWLLSPLSETERKTLVQLATKVLTRAQQHAAETATFDAAACLSPASSN